MNFGVVGTTLTWWEKTDVYKRQLLAQTMKAGFVQGLAEFFSFSSRSVSISDSGGGLSVPDKMCIRDRLQSATQALSNGRGDYARLYPLLAPEQLQQMAGTVRTPLYDYAMRRREASGRRETRPRQNKHASSPNLTPTPNADTVLSPDSMALAASDADKTFEAQADETDATSDTFLFIPAGDSE